MPDQHSGAEPPGTISIGVGIEPSTCRLRAVRFVRAPAATGCYKFLSFVRFTSFLLDGVCYWHTLDYARF